MKTIKFLFPIIALSFLLISCEKLDDGRTIVADAKISYSVPSGNFTPHEKVEFNIILTGAEGATSVSVTNLGGTNPGTPATPIAKQPTFTINVVDGKALFSKTLTELGMTGVGSTINLLTELTLDGSVFPSIQKLTIVSPVSFTSTGGAAPSATVPANGTLVNQIGAAATLNANVIFTIANTKPGIVIDSIKVYRRIGATGTASLLSKPSGNWLTPKDTIKISGPNFLGGNSVQQRIEVFSNGVASFSAWRAVDVIKHTFPSVSAAINLTPTAPTNVYNLLENRFAINEETSDIHYVLVTADNFLSIQSKTGALFVKSTRTEYNNNDIVKLKSAFENSALQLTTIPDVDVDDVYIYKVVRGTSTKYGVFIINSVVRTNNNNTDNFTFAYRYE
jgi:hypothetical protein